MPFHFPLQAVLRYRQGIEHQQELRLRAANQQVARLRHILEQVEGRRRELESTQSQALTSGVTSAELRFGLQCQTELLCAKQEIEGQLARAKQWRDQQRAIFQQARRTRETLEAVRDRQLRLHQREAARHDQRALDDLFLLRREYLRHS